LPGIDEGPLAGREIRAAASILGRKLREAMVSDI